MEEPAVQQEKIEGVWEGGQNGGKADWKNERSLSSFLKHSCFLCWSSPREPDAVETDERVITKAAEIRELENALAMEKLDLQEQQSDRKELEETLVKMEKHKEKLIQQIKTIRQLCYNESQQILSLQADEMQKESQVEEYERELARARWRLKKLREEVKQAKRKVDEAGERNDPLQDSIRQFYEEILQEECTLFTLSRGAVTPDSQLDESASPADTTEDDSLPIRPWGRSQSLPAYADLIMRASSFGNNLACTREEADDSGSSSSKMDRSYIEDDPEERDLINEEATEGVKEKSDVDANPLSHMDFYQADPFPHCQNEHDLFHEDLFPKTDSSDGFASDPFKGSDPFAADILFPKLNINTDEGAANNGDEGNTSLSCAENRASTGTQCFESEFPEEDSDIEISYSQEDLDTIGAAEASYGFKPIQSSSEELGAEPIHQWMSQGQYSVESDPNGYELALGALSPPSDIEEQSLASTAGDTKTTEQDFSGVPVVNEPVLNEPSRMGNLEQTYNADSSNGVEWVCNVEEELGNSEVPKNSPQSETLFIQPDCELDSELCTDLNYEPTTNSSFDPYGFKLSPEHSHHTLLDPDEEELSPQCSGNDIVFVSDPSPSQPDADDFSYSPHPYEFDTPSAEMTRDSDPYGFKLSPEPENQEDLELCSHNDLETMDICTFDRLLEVLEAQTTKNQQINENCSQSNQEPLDLSDNGNREVLEPSDNVELIHENEEIFNLCSHDSQDVVGPYDSNMIDKLTEPGNSSPGHQEVLDLDSNIYAEFKDSTENHEVRLLPSDGNQDVCTNDDKEVLSLGHHDNQDVLEFLSKDMFPEANNNKCVVESKVSVRSTSNSSESDVDTKDLLGFGLDNSICTSNRPNTTIAESVHVDVSSISSTQDLTTSNAPISHILLEGDLGSVFGAGGYIGCPDVADDLEPLDRRQAYPVPEPVQPIRPVRPPRPSLRAKETGQSQSIDLK